MHTFASLICVLRCAGCEIRRCECNARQFQRVHPRRQSCTVDERRADQLKRGRCAAPLGQVRRLHQADTRVEQRGLKMRDSRAGHHPCKTRLGEKHFTPPALYRHNMQRAANALFLIGKAGKLTGGQAVAGRQRVDADKALKPGLQHAALNLAA